MEISTWIILFIVFLSLATAYLFPRVGLRAVLKHRQMAAEREQVEDALKHLLDQKWENRSATAATLKASLSLSDRRALELTNRLATQRLVNTRGSDLVLTPEGERLALQVARAHRLLERYLADEARMPLAQIHKEAHRREHHVSPAQVDELEASLGHPASDPHGDPIPTRGGALPQKETRPLTLWTQERIGRVVHIEDEPAIAYAQIQAEGIHLGQTLRLVEAAPDRFVLTDGENEFRLAPAIAANVHLEPVEELAPHKGLVPLYQLRSQQAGEIIALDEACQGFTRRRFLDLGLTPGTLIYPELSNAFGDPRAYRVRGTLIALRRDQADQIWVQPVLVENSPSA